MRADSAASQSGQAADQGRTRGVNSVRYADQFSSIQAALDDLPGGGILIIPPGVYTVASIKTDAYGTYGILINHFSGLKIIGYGATITYSASNNDARVLEVRSSEQVSIEGLTIAGERQLGTAISFRQPRGAGHGIKTTNNVVRNVNVSGFNLGIEMGFAADHGQVSENTVEESVITDCKTAIRQDGDATETIVYRHVTAQSFAVNHATLFDLAQHSATLIGVVTGGNAVDLRHLVIGPAMRNLVLLNPHMEIAQSGSSSDPGVALEWLAANTAGAYVEVLGGVIADFRRSGTSTLVRMNHTKTAGILALRNTVLYRAGGKASMEIGRPPFLVREGGVWTNIAGAAASGPAVVGMNGVPGQFAAANSNARTWTMPDASGSVSLLRLQDCGTSSTCKAVALVPAMIVQGSVRLSGGTAKVAGFNPPFAGTHSFVCTCTDATSAQSCSVANDGRDSIRLTGSSDHTLHYRCSGN